MLQHLMCDLAVFSKSYFSSSLSGSFVAPLGHCWLCCFCRSSIWTQHISTTLQQHYSCLHTHVSIKVCPSLFLSFGPSLDFFKEALCGLHEMLPQFHLSKNVLSLLPQVSLFCLFIHPNGSWLCWFADWWLRLTCFFHNCTHHKTSILLPPSGLSVCVCSVISIVHTTSR